ncbi:MAG: carbohydrate ABC transporter permease [Clostridiales bacterium]|jgi:putative aldouronate transport system permease protein|nr:carbohydrate ABC transporter permease [Clostridiales bacterium]
MSARTKIKDKSLINKLSPAEGILFYGLLCVLMIAVAVPFLTLVASSFSSSSLIRANGARPWIQAFSLDAYKIVFMYPGDMLYSYLVSVVVTAAGSALNILLCAMVGYSTSRSTFRGRNIVTFFFAFTIMFQAGFVPQYILYRNYLNLYNTWAVLILGPVVIVPHIIILRAFYAGVPGELYDAAKVDGASQYRTCFQIATPLIAPGIATVVFYSVLTYWNDPFTAMLYTDDLVPVALYLSRITQYIEFLKYAQQNGFAGLDVAGSEIPEDTLLYAIAIATTAPMLFIFTLFQRFFVRGLASGAVKG